MTRLVSKVYSMGPGNRDHNGAFARMWRLCRAMWVDQGTVVVKPSELPEGLRGAITQWANDQYGERRNAR